MPSKPVIILVTSVGGDIGQSIVKCLRLMDLPMSILGCDADARGIGEAFVERFFPVPMASDAGYLERLGSIGRDQNVDLIIPGCEPEIFALSRATQQGALACRAGLVCQSHTWLTTYGDKLNCFRALDGHVPLAPYADGTDAAAVARLVEQTGFPCIVKSRRSWGSRSLAMASNRQELDAFLAHTSGPVVQGYIGEEHGEYSVGVFACQEFTQAVAFRRDLGPIGASWYADNFVQDAEVVDYALAVARVSSVRGSCNVQVRKSAVGVRLLEINPRFSSLVAARAACGFRDLEWSVRAALGMDIPLPPTPYRPVRFRRFFDELIDFGDGFAALEEWQPRTRPLPNTEPPQ